MASSHKHHHFPFYHNPAAARHQYSLDIETTSSTSMTKSSLATGDVKFPQSLSETTSLATRTTNIVGTSASTPDKPSSPTSQKLGHENIRERALISSIQLYKSNSSPMNGQTNGLPTSTSSSSTSSSSSSSTSAAGGGGPNSSSIATLSAAVVTVESDLISNTKRVHRNIMLSNSKSLTALSSALVPDNQSTSRDITINNNPIDYNEFNLMPISPNLLSHVVGASLSLNNSQNKSDQATVDRMLTIVKPAVSTSSSAYSYGTTASSSSQLGLEHRLSLSSTHYNSDRQMDDELDARSSPRGRDVVPVGPKKTSGSKKSVQKKAAQSLDETSSFGDEALSSGVYISEPPSIGDISSRVIAKEKKTGRRRFGFGWVGKNARRRGTKKQINNSTSGSLPVGKKSHTMNTHQTDNSLLRSDTSDYATEATDEIKEINSLNATASSSQTNTANEAAATNKEENVTAFKLDWSEHAKQGVHIWYDASNLENYDTCYLSDPDILEFHRLSNSCRCTLSARNENKKRCSLCKIVIHESCIDKLQQNIKCKVTFREAMNKRKSFKDTKESALSPSAQSNPVQSQTLYHHWTCHKYDEKNNASRCQSCLKSYTNRFGLPTTQTIVVCSWCKVTYHFKCFKPCLFKYECRLGEFNQLIVPPSWIVKSSNKNSFRTSSTHYHFMSRLSSTRSSKRQLYNHSQSVDNSGSNKEASNKQQPQSSSSTPNTFRQTSSFILRPSPPTSASFNSMNLTKPLLVLVNPKSGGKSGLKLIRKFWWWLNPRQVFDLTAPGGPKTALHLYRNVPNLRVLVCGGDGSVGWVLSVIDQIKFISTPPPVAVLPLGTGNDLARALNWGSAYTDESIYKILTKILESRTVRLDRWKISTKPINDKRNNTLENRENAVSHLLNDVMNNYFSLGADAHVCLEFHERREANHDRFSSRFFNMLQYAEMGGKDIIKKTWKDLKDYIKLECDGKEYTDLVKSRGYHCIIFLNIPKYSAGTNPWGNSSSDQTYMPQSMNDGRLEVIGCWTSSLPKFQIGGTGERICQAKNIKLTTYTNIPIQIDGEPSKLVPSMIEIHHKNQALMLEHVKYNTDSPLLGYHLSNVPKNFQVKCVRLTDYMSNRRNIELLEKNAIHIGTICTPNFTDHLSKVKFTVNLLIKNCANGFYTDKWTFLNGDEFYRIGDDSDESLLDIISHDEIIYILDETDESAAKTVDNRTTRQQGSNENSAPSSTTSTTQSLAKLLTMHHTSNQPTTTTTSHQYI